MGAAKIVGIDISTGMIDGAMTHKEKGQNEFFLVGDAAGLKQQLIDQSAECNLMVRIKNAIAPLFVSLLCLHAINQSMMLTLLSFPVPPRLCPSKLGSNFDVGLFDLCVSVFLFNYMTISGMNQTFEDVYSLLKPGKIPSLGPDTRKRTFFDVFWNCYRSCISLGGHFVFSVPHPFMASHNSATFGFHGSKTGSYFSMRDTCIEGHIGTIDGERLNVRCVFSNYGGFVFGMTSIFQLLTDSSFRL